MLLQESKKAKAMVKPTVVNLKSALRELCLGRIFWVRNVVLATHYGDAAAVTNCLLKGEGLRLRRIPC